MQTSWDYFQKATLLPAYQWQCLCEVVYCSYWSLVADERHQLVDCPSTGRPQLDADGAQWPVTGHGHAGGLGGSQVGA